MARTYVKYKNRSGFWISEPYLQLAYNYIYAELVKPQYNLECKVDLLSFIKFQIDGFALDMMSLGWNSYFVNETEIQVMIGILQQVNIDLFAKGTYIATQELRLIQSKDEYFKNFYYYKHFPVTELIKIIDAIIQLLENTWETINYNMEIIY